MILIDWEKDNHPQIQDPHRLRWEGSVYSRKREPLKVTCRCLPIISPRRRKNVTVHIHPEQTQSSDPNKQLLWTMAHQDF